MFELLIRKYTIYLIEARGLLEKTIDTTLSSLNVLHQLYKGDLKKLSPRKLIKLKNALREYEVNGKKLSLKRIRKNLNDISKFLTWLSFQPGYKSKIQPDLISYLSLSNEEMAKTYITDPRDFPILSYVVQLCEMIVINNIIDLRDRAIIAFLMFFGLRNESLRTLKLGSIDRISLELMQSPPDGNLFGILISEQSIKIFSPWDQSGPSITITSPPDGSSTQQESITINGLVNDDNGVSWLKYKLNSGSWIDISFTGNTFTHVVSLVEGMNTITYQAQDSYSNQSDNILHITRFFVPDSPQNVSIETISSTETITWDPVDGADSYIVYSSDDPNTGFTEDMSGTFDGESWSTTITSEKKFYYVKAVSE